MNVTLQKLIDEQKETSFVDPSATTDFEALGILISQHFDWDGLAILKTTYSALEDANFHTENKQVEAMIDRVEKDWA
jgi:hypothetical protein